MTKALRGRNKGTEVLTKALRGVDKEVVTKAMRGVDKDTDGRNQKALMGVAKGTKGRRQRHRGADTKTATEEWRQRH